MLKNAKTTLFITLIAFLFVSHVYAQGTWTNYTNADWVYDSYREGDTLWCATGGGLVKWDLSDSTYKKYTTADGMPETICSSVKVDSNGVLWIEYEWGIASFDGTAFTTYNTIDGHPLGGWGDIVISSNNEVWVKSGDGVARFDGTDWTFFGADVGFKSRPNDMDIDSSGIVWVATNFGLYSYDGFSWAKHDGLPFGMATAVTHDNEGNIYVGTSQEVYGKPSLSDENIYPNPSSTPQTGTLGAVSKFESETWTTYLLTGEDSSQSPRTISVKDDTLLIAKSNIVIAINAQTMQPFNTGNFYFELMCNSINTDEYGTVWLSTWTGLHKLEEKTAIYYPMNDGIAHACINDIAIDNSGNVWIATLGGVSCFDGVSWQSYYEKDGLFSNIVRSIAAGPNGEIWTSHERGISKFDGNQWTTAYEGRISTEIAVDSKGFAWVGSLKDSYFFRYNGNIFTTYRIPVDMYHNPINDFEFEETGRIWIATYSSGIVSYINGFWKFITIDDGLPSNTVNDIAFDQIGNLWAATENGLVVLEDSRWTVFSEPSKYFHAVGITPDGIVWAGSAGGLSYKDENGWHTFRQEDGLIENNISKIAIAPDGTIWATHRSYPRDGGISHYIPENITNVQNSDIQNGTSIIVSNYPNPFNNLTTITYSLTKPMHMTLNVYSITGQKVVTLVNEVMTTGTHSVVFDSTGLASGVYFYRFEADGFEKTGRMMLVK
ncbi:two-component regulator propeller domain-containing protein [Candidatus Latescibacterota bacterium]